MGLIQPIKAFMMSHACKSALKQHSIVVERNYV